MRTPSVSRRIGSSEACAYVGFSFPVSRFTNNSFDPYSAAPGRMIASAIAMASSVRAFIMRSMLRIAGDAQHAPHDEGTHARCHGYRAGDHSAGSSGIRVERIIRETAHRKRETDVRARFA